MNKRRLLVFVVCAALALAGCAADASSGAAVYIAPELFCGESVVPSSAPSATLPKRDKLRRNMPCYQYDAADGADITRYTSAMKYEVQGGYFVGEEFTFPLPEGWGADNLEVSVSEKTLEGFVIRQFMFYYLDSTSPQKALIMKIDSLPSAYQDENPADYGENLGASFDGTHIYLRAAVAGSVDDGFGNAAGYNAALAALTAPDYIIQLNV